MIYVIIALSFLCIYLIVRLVKEIRFQKDVRKQLEYIKGKDTNRVVNCGAGGENAKFVNCINEILEEKRKESILYQRKSHDVDQMITNISHDIRTPLTSALGYINIIRNFDLDEDEKNRELEVIERRMKRMEELIDQFFEFSKVISKDEEIKKEKINLISALEEAIAHYFDDYEEKGRIIKLDYKSRKEFLFSNRGMLLRIFDNIINNALKHGEGDLCISVTKVEDEYTIEFANDVDDDNLDVDQIFDEFYTTDISRTKGSTGLGLAIVKQFTELLGGNVSAEKKEKKFSVIVKFESFEEKTDN